MTGDDITIEQATELSKAGGGCGGPFWPVKQSVSRKTQRFEFEAKRIASELGGNFSVVNALTRNAPWWKRNTIYLKWLGMKSDLKQRKYGLKHKPALVVRTGKKAKVFYDLDDLEKGVRNFISQAQYLN